MESETIKCSGQEEGAVDEAKEKRVFLILFLQTTQVPGQLPFGLSPSTKGESPSHSSVGQVQCSQSLSRYPCPLSYNRTKASPSTEYLDTVLGSPRASPCPVLPGWPFQKSRTRLLSSWTCPNTQHWPGWNSAEAPCRKALGNKRNDARKKETSLPCL